MNTEIKTLNGWYEFSNRTGKELVSDSNKSFDEISDGKYSSNRIGSVPFINTPCFFIKFGTIWLNSSSVKCPLKLI